MAEKKSSGPDIRPKADASVAGVTPVEPKPASCGVKPSVSIVGIEVCAKCGLKKDGACGCAALPA